MTLHIPDFSGEGNEQVMRLSNSPHLLMARSSFQARQSPRSKSKEGHLTSTSSSMLGQVISWIRESLTAEKLEGCCQLTDMIEGSFPCSLAGEEGPWCAGLDELTCQHLLGHKGIRVLSRDAWLALPGSSRTLLTRLGLHLAKLEEVAAAVDRVHTPTPSAFIS